MKKSGSVKLQRKIFITNIFLFVIPCLFLSLYIVSFITTEGNRKLNQSKIVILNQINNRLETYVNNAITYSDGFYNNLEINKLISTNYFEDEYEEIQAKRTIRNYISQHQYIYDSDGYPLEILGENGCYSSEEAGGQSVVTFPDLEILKKENWYSLLKKNRICYLPFYESAEFSENDKESAFRIVRLMQNFNSGRLIGIMDINVRYEVLTELLSQGIDGTKQKVFLINDDGVIIGSTDNLMFGKEVTNEFNVPKMIGNDHGYFQVKQDTVVSQINFVTNTSTGWKLVMCEESQNFVWAQSTNYIYMIHVAVIYALIAIVMSVYNSKFISRPVKRLEQDMKKVVYRGDLSIRTDLSDIEEFKELNLQFNLMLGRIEELIDQLKEKDEEKRVLELQALQAQISPHFLYNTLASIRFLIEMEMEEKAAESLLALGKLLRRTFSDYRELIPVREEMENVENYLILMNNRYQGTFEWNIKIEERAEECLIPRISIQPLVENSISHGFSGKEDMGHIRIEALIEKEELLILINDDGVGGSAEKIDHLIHGSSEIRRKEQVSGIGIRNVQERLCIFFGREYGMTAKNTEDGGICIMIRIPVLYERELEKKSV